MQFQCPKCSGVVRIDAANLGKTISCGHCSEIVNAPADRFAPGVVINDFVIEREVGVGGMGVVYLAKQITLDRPVALKILKEKYASDSDFIVQFVREARSAAKLNHHSIVQAYAVGEDEGVFFFAMEFVDGKTMKEVLAEEKKIEYLKAAKIIRDIANALDYAWTERKIVHHDIKPDNIMLTKNNKAKLADLGLAGIFGESSVADDENEVLGTPQYICPEQLLGDPTDVRSDIYSLGATFYQFVTGTFPYNGSSVTEIAHQHVNGVYEPPIMREPSLPPALNDIIGKIMARNIEERYQSAADVAEDLQNFLRDSGMVSTNTTVSAPIPMPAKFPSGGLKLSGSRDKAPAAAKAPEKNAAASAPAASPAPSVKLSIGGAKSGEAPKLGLKKAEPPAPEKKDEPAKQEAPEKEPDAKEKSAKDNKGPKASPAKGNKKASSGKDKVKAVPVKEKKKIPVGLIILAVIILAAGGGVTYYLYKNNWKAPIWDKIVAWNNARKEVAKNAVRRIPVQKRKEPTIQELRKDYTVEAEALKKFIADNPKSGREFIEKIEAFNAKWGLPELENEKKPYAELLAISNEMDEKFWCAPGRNPLKSAHQTEINRRVNQEKARIAEEKRIQAERKADEARRIAHQRAEAELRRKETEERRRAEQKTREYRQKITPFYPKAAKLFYEAIFSETKAADFKRMIDNLFTDYTPDGGVQMALYEQAKSYALKLQGLLPHAAKSYRFIMDNNSRFCSHVLVLPRLGQVEITEVDFPKHKVVVRSIISQKKHTLSLDDMKMRNRFFTLFLRKIEDGDGIGYLQFYYELFFGKAGNAAKLEAPSADWKEFFKYYR